MIFNKIRTPFIVAEIGANHNGNLKTAKKMIISAKKIGCHGVKLQSFDERLFSSVLYNESKFLDDGRDLKNDLRKTVNNYSLNNEEIKSLCHFAHKNKIKISSSVFEIDHIEPLVEAKVDFIKIASGDINNIHLLRATAQTKLPMIVSTGMASIYEISKAIDIIENEGNRNYMILHCVSLYPPPDHLINLKNIEMLRSTFQVPVGFSDHTIGCEISFAAIARGALLIEKHFTLDKNQEGWDHALSADVKEMEKLVKGAKKIFHALGKEKRIIGKEELKQREVFRRSIVAKKNIPKGKILTLDDLSYKRPGSGIKPEDESLIIGLKAKKDIFQDDILSISDFK